ncbi:triose-phosphate isomerase [bacterium]|nr:triose-phosphate isomerase [bacterium]
MTRTPIFAANWKMNKSISETAEFCQAFSEHIIDPRSADVVIIPPFTNISMTRSLLRPTIGVGAQTVSHYLSGAYTGEVSVEMVASAGCSHVIIGHSERRSLFNETASLLTEKLQRVIAAQLTAIFCVGETLADRESNLTESVLLDQLHSSLKPLATQLVDAPNQLVIAYEPVWAIGTGKVATIDQAQAAHYFIRKTVANILGSEAADTIRIQYGGSVKPDNIAQLMTQPDIDGALVGGASLDPESFYEIIKNGIIT